MIIRKDYHPQKLELHRAWIDELGNDWKQIHQKYVYTIGNLTLTVYLDSR